MSVGPDTAAEILVSATGRESVAEALAWITEGHRLDADVDVHRLIGALAEFRDEHDVLPAARRLAREAAESPLDVVAPLFAIDEIATPDAFRSALDLLAWKSRDHDLRNTNHAAVANALREDPFVIEALCAVAGMSYGELRRRVTELPADPGAGMSPNQVRAAFDAIDSVVRGRDQVQLTGAAATRPLELMDGMCGAAGRGWQAVEQMRRGGVPYEVLLAQRRVGGAWNAHRGRTQSAYNAVAARQLAAQLDARGIAHRLVTTFGGDMTPSELQALADADGPVGLVVVDGRGGAVYAVTVSLASDGGSARKKAPLLEDITTQADLPIAHLLLGTGWGERGGTAELALHSHGRVFFGHEIPALVDDIGLHLSPTE